MHHHATGLPGAASQHSKRKSKSFIFGFLPHGLDLLTLLTGLFPLAKGLLLRLQQGAVLLCSTFLAYFLGLQDKCNPFAIHFFGKA